MGYEISRPLLRTWGRRQAFHPADSARAEVVRRSLGERIRRGETTYLIGLGAGGHDSGAALIEVSPGSGIRLLSSHEEERFVGVRYYARHPLESLERVRADLDRLGLFPKDVHACLTTFDYVQLFARGVQTVLEELPRSVRLIHPGVYPDGLGPAWGGFQAARLLRRKVSSIDRIPTVGIRHHDAHAAFAWKASPFATLDSSTVVLVVDAHGDDSSVSCFLGQAGRLVRIYDNERFWDSLGHFYGFLSSFFTGLPIGRAEGIWMAAASFGDRDRETNPFYPLVSSLVAADARSLPRIDRSLANWHVAGAREPFSGQFLRRATRVSGQLAGPMPDFSYESVPPAHADLAAATQIVFEERLVSLIDHALRETRARQLVLTGGTALNCVANMRILQAFDEDYFDRELGQAGSRLDLWIPPAPADDGTPAGAAMQFAMASGAAPGESLRHAFYCGESPGDREVLDSLAVAAEVEFEQVLDRVHLDPTDGIALLLARIVAEGGVVGLFRGRAELGRRALGHRSIFANPCSAKMRDYVNRVVKERAPFRPLAPICTTRDARRWFDLDATPGPLDRSAYAWMAIAARVLPGARAALPAVVHVDGTARLQVVSEEDPLLWGFLAHLGRLIGAEVAINTSLNLRSPIVQTPAQAIRLLSRSAGLDAILLLAESGGAYLCWNGRLDARRSSRVRRWLREWRSALPGAAIARQRL